MAKGAITMREEYKQDLRVKRYGAKKKVAENQ